MSPGPGSPGFGILRLLRPLRLHRLLLLVVACLGQDPSGQQPLRCPLESQSIPFAGPGAATAGSRRLWPAVLELLNLGFQALFQQKDVPRARRLLADALDVAQGRWDHGAPAEAAQETAYLLPAMGFPASVDTAPPSAAAPAAGLERAFRECPLGLSAAYRALAVTHLADAKARESDRSLARALALAQRFQHLGYGWLIALYNVGPEQQDPGYIDLSAWPITGEEWETERHSVAESLKRIGGPASAARPGVAKTSRLAGAKIAVVTVCAYPEGSLLPHFAASVHRAYTERHGYAYVHHQDEEERLSAGRPKAWAKLRALHDALEDGRWDWVLWADCDIYFMGLDTTLDSLLLRYASRPGLGPTGAVEPDDALDPAVRLVITEDAQSLNTAIFFMKRSDWSLRLLRSVWGMDDAVVAYPFASQADWKRASSPFLSHPWWEQAAFTQRLLGSTHRRFQELPYPPEEPAGGSLPVPYPEQVRIAPQWEMNSYHVISSRLDEDTTWVPGRFVMSFNGVKSLSGPVVAQVLASNYYEAFCALNGLRDSCEQGLRSLSKDRGLWGEHAADGEGLGSMEALEAAMFAPWMRPPPQASL